MLQGRERISQITLPDPDDFDPHPRLLIDGDGIHAGQVFTVLLPDGWHEVRLEVREVYGPACWYIAAPDEYRDICPVGLFVKRR